MCINFNKIHRKIEEKGRGISISSKSVKRWVDRWNRTKKLADRPRDKREKLLISNAGMLALKKVLLENL